jgi:hypothetical protein
MKKILCWLGWFEFLGILAFFLGAIYALEGDSFMENAREGGLVILAGSATITLVGYFRRSKRRIGFLTGFLMILFGVGYLIVLSSIPNIEQVDKNRWWLLPSITYPIGWILVVVLLSIRVFKKLPHPKGGTAEASKGTSKGFSAGVSRKVPKKVLKKEPVDDPMIHSTKMSAKIPSNESSAETSNEPLAVISKKTSVKTPIKVPKKVPSKASKKKD